MRKWGLIDFINQLNYKDLKDSESYNSYSIANNATSNMITERTVHMVQTGLYGVGVQATIGCYWQTIIISDQSVVCMDLLCSLSSWSAQLARSLGWGFINQKKPR